MVAIQLPPVSVYTQTCFDTPSQVSHSLTATDWEEMYHAQTLVILETKNRIAELETEVSELTFDSDQVCTQLSIYKIKCEKLEEALRAANSEAVIVNSEAQITHSQLLASEKDASAAAVKAEKLIKVGQENLGSWKDKVLTLRKSNEKARKALEVSQN